MPSSTLAIHAALPGVDHSPLHARFWQLFDSVCAGGEIADTELAALTGQVEESGPTSLVVDLMALRALALLVQEQVEAALDLARQAVRVALADQGCRPLAHLVLARACRIHGEPHRAARLLGPLREHAHPALHAWIDWEHVLTGDQSVEATAPDARELADLLRVDRDRESWRQALLALRAQLTAATPLRQDLDAVELALDARASGMAPADVLAWRAGELHNLPWGLSGLSRAARPVCAVSSPEGAGVRVLDVGLPLLGDPLAHLDAELVPQGHPEAVLAALALVGPAGMKDDALFQMIHGFPFQRGMHQGMLDSLMQRARARLGVHGQIERRDDVHVLHTPKSLVVPDPRSGPKDDDRVLQLVATRGSLTAREASDILGVSIRKAQLALEALAETGACLQVKHGRQHEYLLQTDEAPGAEPSDPPPH